MNQDEKAKIRAVVSEAVVNSVKRIQTGGSREQHFMPDSLIIPLSSALEAALDEYDKIIETRRFGSPIE